MLSYDASISEEASDIQAYSVRHTRFDSRKVSHSGTLLDDLARLPPDCRLRVIWGEGDDAPFRPAGVLIGQLRAVVPGLDVQRVAQAGHWSAYENASAVNRLLLEFFTTFWKHF
jgi:pimeloyl-ACP methyl ester carboxylesterase